MKKWTKLEKNKLRAKKEWKDLRSNILTERGPIDQLTGKKNKKLHLHHLCPEEYDVLDPWRFILVGSHSHRFIEMINRDNIDTAIDMLIDIRELWREIDYQRLISEKDTN
jgi:hypothetical protein